MNVPLIEVRGEWISQVNQKELQNRVIEALVLKPSRLTGSEVRFLRLVSEMNLKQFAQRFDVTHPAVLKWEKTENKETGMSWTTEKDIRLFALKNLAPGAKEFLLTYDHLSEVAHAKLQVIKIDLEKRSA